MENEDVSDGDDWLSSRSLEERVIFFAVLAVSLLVVADIENYERMWWPYLLTTYALGAVVFLYETAKIPAAQKPSLVTYLFPRDAWLTASAQHDFSVTLINYLALSGLTGYLVLNENKIPRMLLHSLGHVTPIRHDANPTTCIIILYSLISWLLADFFHYFAHRASHQIGWLWEFHKVHHSARNLNPLTVSRAHPVDVLLISNARGFGMVLAGIIFFYFYPNLSGVVTIAGVNLFIFFFYFFGTSLHHTGIWMGYGPLEYIFLSPAQHQIHHSEDPKHYNRNYASILSLWDWIFGTLYVTQGRENLSFGLGSENHNYGTLKDLYLRPIVRVAKKIRRRRAAHIS